MPERGTVGYTRVRDIQIIFTEYSIAMRSGELTHPAA